MSGVGLPRLRILDPRPAEVAKASPLLDSVNIPFEELTSRTHELPPPRESVILPDLPEAVPAGEWLLSRGRQVTFIEPRFGPPSRGRLWEPSPFLAEVVRNLQPGRALDVGCGTGRDAVYLAALGWEVVAVDHLPDALERGRTLAERSLPEAAQIEWRLLDVRRQLIDGRFDLILQVAFLARNLLQDLPARLNPGGSIVIETFSTVHRAKFGRPANAELAIDPDEFASLAPGLHVEHGEANWIGDRHLARFWARLRVDSDPRP